ncbi:MAG TPA: hypothetical protein VGO68_10045 [Pyrinomonadaceae bacterium]|nr:hypothetical protein [Pyrinomonadaceae bacterium]
MGCANFEIVAGRDFSGGNTTAPFAAEGFTAELGELSLGGVNAAGVGEATTA